MFEDSLERLNDDQLRYVVTQLRNHPFDRNAVPTLKLAQQRLAELLAQLPGSESTLNTASPVPESDRREIEDYFRNLSDDFGEESGPDTPSK